jgi:DNA polymerase-4
MTTLLYAEVPCFYAAVERALDPALARRPVVVGGDPRKRGLVQSATRDALAAGVRVGMPMLEALERCPQARALQTRMRRYRDASLRLRACLRRHVHELEPAGLAAAFLDAGRAAAPPEEIAERLRADVDAELRLPLRVGIAAVKFVAVLAAEEVGDTGVRRVAPGGEAEFLAPLPLARLPGLGPRSEATLRELGAATVGDLAAMPRAVLERALGNHGVRLWTQALGRGDERVRAARHAQSLSQQCGIERDPGDRELVSGHARALAKRLEEALALQGLVAGRVVLKLRYADGESTTRSATVARPVATASEVHRIASDLLARTHAGSRPVDLVSLTVSALAPAATADRQLELFPADRP